MSSSSNSNSFDEIFNSRNVKTSDSDYFEENNSNDENYQISMDKYNRKNIFENNSFDNYSENLENQLSKNYNQNLASDNRNSMTNHFYQGLVINCQSEDFDTGKIVDVLNEHAKNIITLMSGGNIYG